MDAIERQLAAMRQHLARTQAEIDQERARLREEEEQLKAVHQLLLAKLSNTEADLERLRRGCPCCDVLLESHEQRKEHIRVCSEGIIAEAVAKEREAIAKLAQEMAYRHETCLASCKCGNGYHIAAAIRARGETT